MKRLFFVLFSLTLILGSCGSSESKDIKIGREAYQKYYKKVLKELDPKETYKKLDGLILLCYEDNMDFCHRHIVAGWFELLLGVDIKEVTVINKKLIEVDKPRYIKEYLEELIRKEGRFK